MNSLVFNIAPFCCFRDFTPFIPWGDGLQLFPYSPSQLLLNVDLKSFSSIPDWLDSLEVYPHNTKWEFFKGFLGVWLICEEDLWLYKIYKDLMRCCSYETQYCSTPWSLSVTLSYCPWLLKDRWCTDSELQCVLRQTDHLYLTGCF